MRLIITLNLILINFAVFAQNDSLQWLPEVNIPASRFSNSRTVVNRDTSETTPVIKLTAGNIAAQLDRESNVFVRNYGPGSMSLISTRGTNTSQTALLWNGMQLQSAMLGMYDLSLLPSFLIGSATLQYGGCSPVAGSGAMGGALELNSFAAIHEGYKAEIFGGAGSFGHYQSGIAFSGGNNSFSSSSRVYYQTSSNNFPFTDPEGVSRKQKNAAFRQIAGTQDLTFSGKAGRLGIYLWYLENYREIPPLMVSGNSFQEQDDQSARAVIEWNYQKRNLHYQLRTGISREKIIFRDRTALLDEKSIGHIVQPSALIAWQANSHFRITGEFSSLYNSAEVEYYGADVKTAVQHTLSTTMNYISEKVHADFSVRAGIFNSDVLPLTPSMGLLMKNKQFPSLRLEAAMMYRNPTLNDLYWRPGGNPDLKSEKGYSLSASLEKTQSIKALFLKLNTGIFYSEMDRLLTWLPLENGQYTATNLNGLESKGIELSFLGRTCFSKLNFTANVKYQYNLSVLTESNVHYADGINRQMVYTPRHLLKAQAGILYKKIELRYFHGYTGYRYVTQDHSRYLEPFATGELLLSWNGQFRNSGVMVFVNCKNCWNEEYQVIAWRAMPGRYLETGFMIDLKGSKK